MHGFGGGGQWEVWAKTAIVPPRCPPGKTRDRIAAGARFELGPCFRRDDTLSMRRGQVRNREDNMTLIRWGIVP
jgi:hypothetical protein